MSGGVYPGGIPGQAIADVVNSRWFFPALFGGLILVGVEFWQGIVAIDGGTDAKRAKACEMMWGQSVYPWKFENRICYVKGPEGWLPEHLFLRRKK